jgi:hypothetical protein
MRHCRRKPTMLRYLSIPSAKTTCSTISTAPTLVALALSITAAASARTERHRPTSACTQNQKSRPPIQLTGPFEVVHWQCLNHCQDRGWAFAETWDATTHHHSSCKTARWFASAQGLGIHHSLTAHHRTVVPTQLQKSISLARSWHLGRTFPRGFTARMQWSGRTSEVCDQHLRVVAHLLTNLLTCLCARARVCARESPRASSRNHVQLRVA